MVVPSVLMTMELGTKGRKNGAASEFCVKSLDSTYCDWVLAI